MTIVLLVTCLLTPYQIAFRGDSSKREEIMNTVTDFLFGIDIIVNFNSVYYDGDMNLINNRLEIAKNYIKGWFAIDCLAIIPFDKILISSTMKGSNANMSNVARLAKIGRLYKLVKPCCSSNPMAVALR